jgi:MFS family permease
MNLRERIAAARARLPAVYWTVWLGTLINRLGQFVGPLLTFYLTQDRGYELTEAGGIIALLGLGQVAAALVGGVLADRLGRRATMALSLFGAAATMLVLAQARSYDAIAVTVLVLGFTGELYRPAVAALVADVVPAKDRVYAYGLLYWCINIGFAIAPVLGGLLARVDFTILFVADAVTSAVFGALILARVPETRPPREPATSDAPPAPGLASAVADRGYMLLLLLVFLVSLITWQGMVPLSGYMLAQGHDAAVYGAVLAVNGVVIVALQPWLTARIEHRDPSRVLAVAALVTGAGFALHGAGSAIALHAAAVAVWTIGEILASPTSSALVAGFSPAQARGRYQGLFTMAWGAAYLVAPLVGTRVLRDWGSNALWLGCLGLGAIAAIGHVAAAPARRRRMAASTP